MERAAEPALGSPALGSPAAARVAALQAEIHWLRQSLQRIAGRHNMPCRECGEVHEYRPLGDGSATRTWAARDGHFYHSMTDAEFAEYVLNMPFSDA
jgi:hypothetical protein